MPIRDIARAFVDLQGLRHDADYDLTERFWRSDVLGLIRDTSNVIQQFKSLAAADDKKFFLASVDDPT